MPKPVCFPCQRFFRCVKTGFYFTEGMPVGSERIEPGTSMPERWRPYKLWSGDKYECQGCGAVIITGFGAREIAVQHEEGFNDQRARLGADKYQVNDC